MTQLNFSVVEIKPFVPARDFARSIEFYEALGFRCASVFAGIAYFHCGESSVGHGPRCGERRAGHDLSTMAHKGVLREMIGAADGGPRVADALPGDFRFPDRSLAEIF